MGLVRVWWLCGVSCLVWACAEDAPPAACEPSCGMGPDMASDLVSEDAGEDLAAPDVEPDQALDMTPDMAPQPAGPLADCDPLDPHVCSFPWPSNLYLVPDAARATGYTLRFGEASLPARGRDQRHIDPAPFARMDGYGLGTSLQVILPGVKIEALAQEESIARSLEEDAAIVWLKVAPNGQLTRIPYFVELDANATADEERVLYVRPAVVLEEATRYVVGMRGLESASGPIAPSAAFAALRDGAPSADPAVEGRRARFEAVFSDLARGGVARDTLTLAWDFVTASSEALHGPLLHMRDDAMARVGPQGPALTVTSVERFDRAQHPHIALQIEGKMRAPHYMRSGGGRWQIQPDERGLPRYLGERDVKFVARVPHAALGGAPQGLITYGHGLLGSRYEILADHIGQLGDRYGYIVVAVDLAGMSAEDALVAQRSVTDVDLFIGIGDRLHQGLLDYLLITRAAREQLGELEIMRQEGVQVDKTRQYYFGGSQGGIFGVTFLALSQEITRGFLAVPGNNYNIMLERSVNFNSFAEGILQTYPRRPDLSVILALLQLHWDRTDPVSYLRRLKAQPFAQTPAHDAIFAVSKGDYQVAVVTNEIASRTLGEALPVLGIYDRERSVWGAQVASYPHVGSGLVLFDFGNPWPMRQNRPPQDGLRDPHPRLAEVDEAGELMTTFFEQGRIVDICGGQACVFGR